MPDGLAKPARWWPGIRAGHPLARDLVGYWPFWEGQGGRAYDVASPFGIANHGTLTGGPTWGSGSLGRALHFSGGDPGSDYVAIPSLSYTGDWTIAFNAYLTASQTIGYVFGPNSGGVGAFLRYTGASNQWGFYTGVSLIYGSADSLQTWTSYAVTKQYTSSSVYTLYKDGEVDGGPYTGQTAVEIAAPTIGRRGDGAWSVLGDMGYFTIWSRALTSGELADHTADPNALIRPRAKTYLYAGGGAPAASIVVLRRRRECA